MTSSHDVAGIRLLQKSLCNGMRARESSASCCTTDLEPKSVSLSGILLHRIFKETFAKGKERLVCAYSRTLSLGSIDYKSVVMDLYFTAVMDLYFTADS